MTIPTTIGGRRYFSISPRGIAHVSTDDGVYDEWDNQYVYRTACGIVPPIHHRHWSHDHQEGTPELDAARVCRRCERVLS